MKISKTKFFGKSGFVALAATAFLPSLACSADFACGGLFLLNDYSMKVGEHSFAANVGYSRYHLNYGDDWDLDIGSYGFPGELGSGNLVGTFSYQSNYKFLTFGASVNTRPWVTANMVLHTTDSMFYVGSELGRGDFDVLRIKLSYKESDVVPDISADWETHILNKGLSFGVNVHGHKLDLAGNYYKSTPFNRDEEYFIRDSLNIWNLSGQYSYSNRTNKHTSKRVEKISIGYRYIKSDINLYGIRSQDGDTKRFMYIPISGSIHIADMEFKDLLGPKSGSATESARTAGTLDLNALAIYAQGNLDNDGKRFHETLAPNRALQTSVLQALSFNFLQMNYRVVADAEGGLGLAGLTYHKTFSNTTKNANIEPKIAANFYYAKASADVELTSESTKLFMTKKEEKKVFWDVSSIGTILNLGLHLAYSHFYLDANAIQLIPFTAEIDDSKPNTNNKKEESYALGNGLFCTLNIGFNF